MYATQADLETRFGTEELVELTDREAGTDVDSNAVERALSDATAQIDSYVSARYTVPLTPVPDVIVRVACDLARYYLYADRVTDQVRQRYEDAIALLQAIARGTAQLSLAEGAAPPVASAGSVSVVGGNRTFSQDTLADYGFDC